MNRRIAKWIQIGLFAAVPAGWIAVAGAGEPPSDTNAPGSMAPSDQPDQKIDQKAKDKSSDDIERTRGTEDKNNVNETTTTTSKKKTHKKTTTAPDSSMKSKSNTDEDMMNPPPSNSDAPHADPTK